MYLSGFDTLAVPLVAALQSTRLDRAARCQGRPLVLVLLCFKRSWQRNKKRTQCAATRSPPQARAFTCLLYAKSGTQPRDAWLAAKLGSGPSPRITLVQVVMDHGRPQRPGAGGPRTRLQKSSMSGCVTGSLHTKLHVASQQKNPGAAWCMLREVCVWHISGGHKARLLMPLCSWPPVAAGDQAAALIIKQRPCMKHTQYCLKRLQALGSSKVSTRQ